MASFALSTAPLAPAVGRSVLPRKPARVNTVLRRGTPFDAGQVRTFGSVWSVQIFRSAGGWCEIRRCCVAFLSEAPHGHPTTLIRDANSGITQLQVNDPEKTAQRKEEKV